MISVHISNENIQVVYGDAKFGLFNIHEYYKAPTPEGAIINGVITDFDALREDIGVLWKQNKISSKGISLVIDSSPVVGKVMRVPYVSQKKIMKFVRRELAPQDDDVILDYSVISVSEDIKKKDKKNYGIDIYACSVQRHLLQSYVDLFESKGIKLSSINLSINSVIKLGHFLRSLKDKTYIIIVLDGNSLASFLFINGKFSISNKYRLTYERGTSPSYMEIIQHVSTLMQFTSTQRSDQKIENAYFCGLYKDEEIICRQINMDLGIGARIFPHNEPEIFVHQKAKGFILSENIYVSGNLI